MFYLNREFSCFLFNNTCSKSSYALKMRDKGRKVLLCLQSFKGCLSGPLAAQYLLHGIQETDPGLNIKVVPISDGGQGTLDILLSHKAGQKASVWATNPLMKQKKVSYGLFPEEEMVFIESARIIGMEGIPVRMQNPWYLSSAGLGEVIHAALALPYPNLLISLGGSATNDGGLGALSALGIKGLNAQNRPVCPGGRGLTQLCRITDQRESSLLHGKTIRLLSDVRNPLTGPQGATETYGPQKGGNPEMIELLEQGMQHFSLLMNKAFPGFRPETPGYGAAGGLGAALSATLDAGPESGFHWMAKQTGLLDLLPEAGLIITGEGSMDAQSLFGKATGELALLAAEAGIPMVAVNGTCPDAERSKLLSLFTEMYELEKLADHPEDSILKAGHWLRETGKNLGKRIRKLMR